MVEKHPFVFSYCPVCGLFIVSSESNIKTAEAFCHYCNVKYEITYGVVSSLSASLPPHVIFCRVGENDVSE